jgi:transcriptional regulator with XRE-family HTH domain
MTNELGNILKELRKNKNMTQKEIADKIHVTQSAYAHYEAGRKEPKIETLLLLAEIHKTSIDYLVGRYGHTEKKAI